MLRNPRPWLVGLVLGGVMTSATAQTPAPATQPVPRAPQTTQAAPTATPAAPAPNSVAATVNGQPITEAAVSRGLKGVEPTRRAAARPELLAYLVDNLLVDQYLAQVPNLKVEPAEVDKRLGDMKVELEKAKQSFPELLKRLDLTEAELREHVASDLRWDKFATERATEQALRELFNANRDMFDGSTVRARHILLPLTPEGPGRLQKIKQDIDAQVAKGLAEKLTANADVLTREKMRTELLDQAFSESAKQNSTCPSHTQGGDVGFFRRAGFMVEPFSKVAFTIKPYQMSEIVQTQFGYHLIMVLEHKPGIEVKFEEVKDDVKEVYCDRLREAVVSKMKPTAKIVITPVANR